MVIRDSAAPRLAMPDDGAEAGATLPRIEAAETRVRLEQAIEAVATVLWGNNEAVRLVFAAVAARGHILLEDIPGVGKTTLARAVARVLGCSFSRVQFTADMLPSDVLGVHVLDPKEGRFEFKKGPIFADVILADEINRASPKTQSAMLEAMSDRQVTVDRSSFRLPEVFTVIATQNPVEHHGAYPLPESQLDRFMARITLGYPPKEEERALILSPGEPERNLAAIEPVFDPGAVAAIQRLVESVRVSEPVADYILALAEATRHHPDILLGCSPRGSVVFAAMARARAFLEGRDFVLPDDVQELAATILTHRIIVAAGPARSGSRQAAQMVVEDIVAQVPVPR
ncbi:MAG: MoxR family ATPase [Myxococcota bacterium]